MSISNRDDIIDSRDIIERIEELESDYDELLEDYDNDPDKVLRECPEEDDRCDDVDMEELKALKNLAEQGENYAPDWNYGEALIHEKHFTDYSKQLCEDIGSIPSDVPAYIADNIDWDGVAEDLKVDYTEVDFDGETYYIR